MVVVDSEKRERSCLIYHTRYREAPFFYPFSFPPDRLTPPSFAHIIRLTMIQKDNEKQLEPFRCRWKSHRHTHTLSPCLSLLHPHHTLLHMSTSLHLNRLPQLQRQLMQLRKPFLPLGLGALIRALALSRRDHDHARRSLRRPRRA